MRITAADIQALRERLDKHYDTQGWALSLMRLRALRFLHFGACVLLVLAGCAPARRPPTTQPKPSPTAPATPGPVATPPPVVEDPTACPADAPEATGYRWYQGNKANPAVKMVCAIAVTKDPGWCEPRFEDPRQHGTCSYFPEGHPRRDACLKTKGKPTFTGPISVREDNEICGDADVGATITACAPSGACGSYTVTP